MPSLRIVLGLAAGLSIGCASAPPAPGEGPAATPAATAPLPRSSIAAVLARRAELGLTAEQVTALGAAEAELEVAIDRAMRERPVPPTDARPPPTRSTGPTPGQPGPPGAPGAGVPGMGSMPGMSGSHGGGPASLTPAQGAAPGAIPPGAPGSSGLPGSAPIPAPRPPSPQAQLDRQLDDLDTAAWLKVEPVLSPAQREQAREIAGDYRAARFEARQRQGAAR
jgi:hypothetical protein